MKLAVGIDDTDSRTGGMCTTYLASVVAEEISGYAEVDDRVLFRLNPDAPHRTRGNACLALYLDTGHPKRVRETVVDAVERLSVHDDPDTNPGAAFLRGTAPDELGQHSIRTVRELVPRDEALAVAEEHAVDVETWGDGRGVVGAVAAVGSRRAMELYGDETLEMLAYRGVDHDGASREYSPESFRRAHRMTYPETWDTVDGDGSVVAVPAAEGPVLYGLRGSSLEAVWRANSYVETQEVQRVAVYRTNQATDMHVVDAAAGRGFGAHEDDSGSGFGEDEDYAGRVDTLRDDGSYLVAGEVQGEPRERRGGHVFVDVDTAYGSLQLAAFEPTKELRDVIRRLREGDEVTVCGSYDDGTLKLEKLKVGALRTVELVKPRCCGRKMESAGRGQGYRCRECGETEDELVERELERDLEPGWYEVPAGARRHLSKPLCRGLPRRRDAADS